MCLVSVFGVQCQKGVPRFAFFFCWMTFYPFFFCAFCAIFMSTFGFTKKLSAGKYSFGLFPVSSSKPQIGFSEIKERRYGSRDWVPLGAMVTLRFPATEYFRYGAIAVRAGKERYSLRNSHIGTGIWVSKLLRFICPKANSDCPQRTF